MRIPPLQTLTKIGTEEQAPRGESRTGRHRRHRGLGAPLQRLTPEQGSIRADTGSPPTCCTLTNQREIKQLRAEMSRQC